MQVLTFVRLVKHLQDQVSKQVRTSGRRASVAAIFRLIPGNDGDYSHLKCPLYEAWLPWNQLRSVIESSSWAPTADVQLLFIKRSQRDTDRHSGQVAFPGGRADGCETPFETCVREGEEEIGIDLSNRSEFAYLGALKEMNPYLMHFHVPSLQLSVHVFVSLNPRPLPIKPNPEEVESYRWASFYKFTHEFDQIWKPKFICFNDIILQKAFAVIGVKSKPKIRCHVGGALLPLKPTNSVAEYADCTSEYHLWGITYRRVRALVLLLELGERQTRKSDWIYYKVEGLYWLSSPFLAGCEYFLLLESAKVKYVYYTAGIGAVTLLAGGVLGYHLISLFI